MPAGPDKPPRASRSVKKSSAGRPAPATSSAWRSAPRALTSKNGLPSTGSRDSFAQRPSSRRNSARSFSSSTRFSPFRTRTTGLPRSCAIQAAARCRMSLPSICSARSTTSTRSAPATARSARRVCVWGVVDAGGVDDRQPGLEQRHPDEHLDPFDPFTGTALHVEGDERAEPLERAGFRLAVREGDADMLIGPIADHGRMGLWSASPWRARRCDRTGR